MMETLLQIDGLVSGYGRNSVLHKVSLTVGRGEIVALVGANGAGKSTLLNTLIGLVPTRAGRIVFAGEDIVGRDTQRIVRAGLVQVPERRQLFGTMTVAENLRMGAYARRDMADVARELAVQFERFPVLRERRNQVAQTLSGGEQQMLAIGRAMMARPKLMLLDEPTLGLAPLLIRRVLDMVRDIRANGGSALLVEQNAHAALGIADRGYVLETGRITLTGRARDLAGNNAVRAAYLGGGGGDGSMEERIRRLRARIRTPG